MGDTTRLTTRLRCSGIWQSYDDTHVLKGVDLEVAQGETVAIMGRSGCGKTTLLRCLALLVIADRGDFALDGQVYLQDGQSAFAQWQVRREIGTVFQNRNLFPNMTVLRNVTLGLERCRGMSRQEAVETAFPALKTLGLAGFEGRYPDQLSSGQAQRVALARAAVLKPSVLLLDEVTSALDPESVATVTEAIRGLRRIDASPGLAIVLVTHFLDFAVSFADRITYMAEGRLVEDWPSKEFARAASHPEAQAFIRQAQAGWIG